MCSLLVVLPLDLQMHLTFDGDTRDTSGLYRHGKNVGLTYTTHSVMGEAAIFDGAAYVIVDRLAGTDLGQVSRVTHMSGSEFTLSFWIKRDALDGLMIVIHTGPEGPLVVTSESDGVINQSLSVSLRLGDGYIYIVNATVNYSPCSLTLC